MTRKDFGNYFTLDELSWALFGVRARGIVSERRKALLLEIWSAKEESDLSRDGKLLLMSLGWDFDEKKETGQ